MITVITMYIRALTMLCRDSCSCAYQVACDVVTVITVHCWGVLTDWVCRLGLQIGSAACFTYVDRYVTSLLSNIWPLGKN